MIKFNFSALGYSRRELVVEIWCPVGQLSLRRPKMSQSWTLRDQSLSVRSGSRRRPTTTSLSSFLAEAGFHKSTSYSAPAWNVLERVYHEIESKCPNRRQHEVTQ